MLQLPGAPAFSSFRIQKLLERIRRDVPGVVGLSAHFVHFVELEQALSQAQREVLEQLLAPLSAPPAETLHSFWVVPRLGTISPWSSKATDIAHNCGLSALRRIERGVRFDLQLQDRAALDAAAFETLVALLHDRMTESVLGSADDAQSMFQQAEPAPFGTVDVLQGGGGEPGGVGVARRPDRGLPSGAGRCWPPPDRRSRSSGCAVPDGPIANPFLSRARPHPP